jgi:hypothetical protein
MYCFLKAPIVDSVFIKKIGKRKTWLVSCFCIVGIIMISVAEYVHNILQSDRAKKSHGYIFNQFSQTMLY